MLSSREALEEYPPIGRDCALLKPSVRTRIWSAWSWAQSRGSNDYGSTSVALALDECRTVFGVRRVRVWSSRSVCVFLWLLI